MQQKANSIFKLTLACIICSVAFKGFGNQIFGFTLSNNVSAYFIYFALFVQLVGASFSVPATLLVVYAGIAVHTFVFNFSSVTFAASLVQLIGILAFSLTLFSFVSSSRHRILHVVRVYYCLAYWAACFAVLQSGIFLLSGESLHLQNLLGGPQVTTGRLAPDILDFLPRASGIASEPAHFALILVPATYISILVLTRKAGALGLKNRGPALIILLSLLLTFSLVGYIGLGLALLVNFVRRNNGLALIMIKLSLVLAIGGIGISQIPSMEARINTFLAAPFSMEDYQFTRNDLSGFALISNVLVARSALEDSYLLGTGLKTHEENYNRYLYTHFTPAQVIEELNKSDAGSLFIRVASEFGVLGIFGLMWFIIRFKIRANSVLSVPIIANDMCFIFLMMYAVRTGSYLDTALWLFVALYYYSSKLVSSEAKNISQGNKLSEPIDGLSAANRHVQN